MKDLRPIGLCNTIYKILTKTISNRIKPFLEDIINHIQSSFVPHMNILDNVLVIKEVANCIKKAKKTTKLMALKIDLSKAYDSLE